MWREIVRAEKCPGGDMFEEEGNVERGECATLVANDVSCSVSL